MIYAMKINKKIHYFVIVEKTNPFLATTMLERKKYKYQSKNFLCLLIPGYIPFSSESVSFLFHQSSKRWLFLFKVILTDV